VSLPRHGVPRDEILGELAALARRDVDWRSGRAFSLAYHAGDDVLALASEVLASFQSTNALNTAAFPSLRKLQRDVVETVAELLHGGPEAAGFMTTGGTESLLLAVKAAREHGRARGVDEPEMLLPASAHAAFEKAAKYFGVRSVRVPVRDDFRADVEATARALSPRTVLVVGSAPQYPQGVVDPIAELARLAADAGVLCHVDACMGGITLPMLERLGRPIPPFDFRVPGVTSISVDLHKYGYTAKGASVILHRSKDLRRHQTFVTENWLGGTYASSGILGTKSGGPIAAAWAVMRHLGEDGYLRLTRAARDATEALAGGLRRIPGVRVLAEPEATLLAFAFEPVGRAPALDAFAVGEALARRGFVVDPQKPPPSLHCTVNAVHGPVVPQFLSELRSAMEEVAAARTHAAQGAYATLE
jgi:glutamate/tyrosine decarboxylase-like PLP-dependent enzyme